MFFKSIYSVLLGVYLGDSVTTGIVCSIGANADAKRVGVINVLFNLSETVLVFVGVAIAPMVCLFCSHHPLFYLHNSAAQLCGGGSSQTAHYPPQRLDYADTDVGEHLRVLFD